MAEFHAAVSYVLKNEGGFDDDPLDPGGKTNMGIASRYHPDVNLETLTASRARELYFDRYWIPTGLQRVSSDIVATKALDVVVHCGVAGGTKVIQMACNSVLKAEARGGYPSQLVVDGWFGVNTLRALESLVSDIRDGSAVVCGLIGAVHHAYLLERTPRERWERYRAGWSVRCARIPLTDSIDVLGSGGKVDAYEARLAEIYAIANRKEETCSPEGAQRTLALIRAKARLGPLAGEAATLQDGED